MTATARHPRAARALTAHARVEAVALAGTVPSTTLRTLRSDGPLALRQTAGSVGPAVVHLVGAAGGPLGGDAYRLDIDVGAGAEVHIRSAAATLLLPGRDPDAVSSLTVRARVGTGGRLVFAPEPVIVAAGAHHRALTSVTLAAGASLVLRERLLLGRHGEAPGRYRGRVEVAADGHPLLRQDTGTGAALPDSPAVYGGAKALGSTVFAGAPFHGAPGPEKAAWPVADGVVVMPLAGPGVLVSALAPDTAVLAARLRWGEARVPGVEAARGWG